LLVPTYSLNVSFSDSEYEAESEPYESDRGSDPDEQTRLLPPSGISSNELDGYGSRAPRRVPATSRSSALYAQSSKRQYAESAETVRMGNATTARQAFVQVRRETHCGYIYWFHCGAYLITFRSANMRVENKREGRAKPEVGRPDDRGTPTFRIRLHPPRHTVITTG
jgi:hypothetical protein